MNRAHKILIVTLAIVVSPQVTLQSENVFPLMRLNILAQLAHLALTMAVVDVLLRQQAMDQ